MGGRKQGLIYAALKGLDSLNSRGKTHGPMQDLDISTTAKPVDRTLRKADPQPILR